MHIAPQCSRKDGGPPPSLLSSCSPESKDRLGSLGHLKVQSIQAYLGAGVPTNAEQEAGQGAGTVWAGVPGSGRRSPL